MANPNVIPTQAKPCVKCGACLRSPRGRCKACVNARAAAWSSANKERRKATNAAWYTKNTERALAGRAAWKSANPDLIKATNAAWYTKNIEQAKEQRAKWKFENPEALRIHSHNRRAKKLAAGGALSKDLAAKLFTLQKGKCPCCKQPLGDDYHLDHIMPLALGGSNTDDNIQLLRSICNLQKSAKDPVEFMQSRGNLI